MNPTKFFLRYAFPCADHRLGIASHDMNPERYDRLEEEMRREEPSRELLEECFPKAMERLAVVASELGVPKWSMESVEEFWRHRHTGDPTPVKIVRVIRKISDGGDNSYEAWKVVYDSLDAKTLEETAFNPYGLDLVPGVYIRIHFHCAIELFESHIG